MTKAITGPAVAIISAKLIDLDWYLPFYIFLVLCGFAVISAIFLKVPKWRETLEEIDDVLEDELDEIGGKRTNKIN